jgi:hypothetical protein
VVAFLAYKVVYARNYGQNHDETPKQSLDNVKQAAKRIEDEAAKKAAADLSAGTTQE